MPEEIKDNITAEEEIQEEETGIDAEEEHRFAEFEDVRDRLAKNRAALVEIKEALNGIKQMIASFANLGAVVHEDEEPTDTPPEELEDLDLEIKD